MYNKEYYQKNKKRIIASALRWQKENPRARSFKKYRRRLKIQVIDHYGGKCVCCQTDIIEFLTIDHVNNDGEKDRKVQRGGYFYGWIIKNNYPKDLQLLCYNCNMAKARYGQCPHIDKFGELS